MEHIVESTAGRLMEDKKQVEQAYEKILSDKIFDAVAAEVTVEAKKTSLEEFESIVAKAREESAAANREEEE